MGMSVSIIMILVNPIKATHAGANLPPPPTWLTEAPKMA